MKLKVSRVDVWAASIVDSPGGLSLPLSALAEAGADFAFVIARRSSEKGGVVFLTPVKGSAQVAAAKKAGFKKAEGMHSIRIEGKDKPGISAKIARKLAAAKINLRGFSAAALGKKFVIYLAVDNAAAATKALSVLTKE